jgi:uncharacterized protein YbcI
VGVLKAERTMLDQGREDLVRSFRQQFENEMSGKLVGLIEEITGRNVVTYQSQIVFDPDMVFEIFVFDDTVDAGGQVTEERGGSPTGA